MREAQRAAIDDVLETKGGHRRRLVSVPDFGREVGVGRTKAYELVERGEVETVYIDSRRLVVAASIDAYIERLRTGVA